MKITKTILQTLLNLIENIKNFFRLMQFYKPSLIYSKAQKQFYKN